jgi:TonB family protein
MRFAILLPLIWFSQVVLAQTAYYDYTLRTTIKEDASYYSQVEPKDSRFLVRLYHINDNTLFSEGVCLALSPRLQREGKYTTYYKNGQLESEGQYVSDKPAGTWKYYHKNGQQSDEERYDEGNHFHIQHWDEVGVAQLTNGTGIYSVDFEESVSYRDIVDQKLICSYRISKALGDTTYTVVEETAEYDGGIEGFYKYLGQNVRYPKTAKRAGVQGKAFVEFVIDKDGSVTNVKVLKGPGAGIDEEAVRVIQSSKKWKPGIVRGKPVRQIMVLPISFRLG